MPEVIISDTSCLILLNNIGQLHLLAELYTNIIITPEIKAEFGEPIPTWISIEQAADQQTQRILELQIDKGESSAIALALEKDDCLVILDDYKARVIAKGLDIKITGTVGVIVKAKLQGLIPSIKPILVKIRETNFRLSNAIEQNALIEAGEN